MTESNKTDFIGKVVIVTGSSSGIGAATAVEFSRRGAFVTITGRNAERLQKTVQQCKTVSPTKHEPLSIIAELTDAKDVEKILKETIKANGRLDILVNNAAILGDVRPAVAQTLESFDEVLATNLRAPFYLTKLAIPELEETKGCIVNVSSSLSTVAVPTMPVYAMTKSALDHFTKTLAVELGPKGIRVNAVNPGYITTNLQRNVEVPKELWKKAMEGVISRTPLRTQGTAEGTALSIAFVASKEASFITGACLFADGGFYLNGALDVSQQ